MAIILCGEVTWSEFVPRQLDIACAEVGVSLQVIAGYCATEQRQAEAGYLINGAT